MKTINNITIIVAVGIACLLDADTSRAQMSEYKFKQQFDIAFQLVLDGQHEEALPIFARLNKADVSHGQVQYLYAVSMMKADRVTNTTAVLLEKAAVVASLYHQVGRVEDKTAPVKVWMYLAKAYESSNAYDKAIDAYRNYMSSIPMASIEHKRGIVASIKKLREEKLAANSMNDVKLLAEITP